MAIDMNQWKEDQLVEKYLEVIPRFFEMVLETKDMKKAKTELLQLHATFQSLIEITSDPLKVLHLKNNLHSIYFFYYSTKGHDNHKKYEKAIFHGMKSLDYVIQSPEFGPESWVEIARVVFSAAYSVNRFKQSHYIIRGAQVIQERARLTGNHEACEKIDPYIKFCIIIQKVSLVKKEFYCYLKNLRDTRHPRYVEIVTRLPVDARVEMLMELDVSQELMTLENLEVPDGDARLEKVPENVLQAIALFKEAEYEFVTYLLNCNDRSGHEEFIDLIKTELLVTIPNMFKNRV